MSPYDLRGARPSVRYLVALSLTGAALAVTASHRRRLIRGAPNIRFTSKCRLCSPCGEYTHAVGSWRPLVLTILLYVTLDLSLASMPGAFVFDAEDSVESVQMSRVRPFPTLTIAPVPAPVPKDVDVNVRPQPIPRPVPPPPIRRGETSRAPAFKLSDLSEDPH